MDIDPDLLEKILALGYKPSYTLDLIYRLRGNTGVDSSFATKEFVVDSLFMSSSTSTRFTATFVCPVTGSVYPSGTLLPGKSCVKGLVDFRTRFNRVEGKVHYPSKEAAEEAAAGRALDCIRFRKLKTTESRFCDEDPSSIIFAHQLPLEVLVKIFSFCSAQELLACDKVCRRFQQGAQADEAWEGGSFSPVPWSTGKHLTGKPEPPPDSRVPSKRLRVCLSRALLLTRKEQKNVSNVFREILGYGDMMKALGSLFVADNGEKTANRSDLVYLQGADPVYLRGDTLAALVYLVEANVVDILETSFKCFLDCCSMLGSDREYPEYSWSILKHHLHTSNFTNSNLFGCVYLGSDDKYDICNLSMDVPQESRDAIILKLVRRAGIIKVAPNALSKVWGLVSRAFWSILSQTESFFIDAELDPILLPGQSIRCVPSRRFLDDAGRHRFVLIPRYVEDAAKHLGFPIHKVYGDEWWCRNTEEVVDDAEAAEREGFLSLYTQLDYEDEPIDDGGLGDEESEEQLWDESWEVGDDSEPEDYEEAEGDDDSELEDDEAVSDVDSEPEDDEEAEGDDGSEIRISIFIE